MTDVAPNRWGADDPPERDNDKKINDDLRAKRRPAWLIFLIVN
jgi:hypothetical protein